MLLDCLRDHPAHVRVYEEDRDAPAGASRVGNEWTTPTVSVVITPASDGTSITVSSPKAPISRIALRWPIQVDTDLLLLGDHWERGYGDLQWRTLQPDRVLPWYFAATSPSTRRSYAAGVKTGPSAFCFFMVDEDGVTLWLDLRNGGMPCLPGPRIIPAATLITTESGPDESAFAMLKRFCALLCPKPRLPSAPVCGSNNWYYAYGHHFNDRQVMRDAMLLNELAGDHANRPFCVIDAGWSPGSVCPGGPWTAGVPDRFPDMPGLASEIKAVGVRPGIWIRPTALTTVDDPRRLRAGPQQSAEKALDLTVVENLEAIRADISRVRSWGYELIKHDFSTWDACGKWGFEMRAALTEAGWSFHDRSVTNAEILLRLYRTLRAAAGDAILLGCNTVGHLAAGLFEVQRTGDDTSGKNWERTRKMGINTLAFRLPQHNTFFAADADCVAQTALTPWSKTRQWLDVVARSGTALFVSVDPITITADVSRAMSDAMRLALSGGEGSCEPMDWFTTTTPRTWKFGDDTVRYHWNDDTGAWPLPC